MKTTRILFSLLLAALLLAGCGTVDTPESVSSPEGTANTVVVTDVAGLLNALAPDTVVEIDASELALDSAPDYGFSYSFGAYTWEAIGDGEYALVIRDLENLTIRSRGEEETRLTTGATFANVITFRACRSLRLEGLTLGHRGEPGSCCGDVLYFDGCEDTLVCGCDLFGCGATAVNAWMCTHLSLEECTLRDCTVSALNATLCTNVQARDCAILRCGGDYGVAVICTASCNGLALINSTIRDCGGSGLLDSMNSSSVCLLGCEATGSKFSEALFQIYDGGVTVSGSALSDNAFGKCYSNDYCCAVTENGTELATFADFVQMERKPFEGEYIGPAPYVTPGDLWNGYYATAGDIGYASPGDIFSPDPAPAWDGERTEVHVQTVDELLAAIAPHTTVYLDGEEFDLSTASDYGVGCGDYYNWVETFDGPGLVLFDLEDFTLSGSGMGVTLVSAVPRYADVLSFEDCRGVVLTDMTIGHSVEPGYCTGDVLEFNWCDGVSVSRCGLFGCGEIGIRAAWGTNLSVIDCNIYDCSYYGAWLENMQNVQFSGCGVTNCGGNYGSNSIYLTDSSGVFFDSRRLLTGENLIEQDT